MHYRACRKSPDIAEGEDARYIALKVKVNAYV